MVTCVERYSGLGIHCLPLGLLEGPNTKLGIHIQNKNPPLVYTTSYKQLNLVEQLRECCQTK